MLTNREYRQPGIRLINGDCREVMKDLSDNSIDLVVTSPPYDDLRTYEGECEWNFYNDLEQGLICFSFQELLPSGIRVYVRILQGEAEGNEFH